ncbi:hypothetical protein QTP70_020395, partial [Hemibagrus guttatus]
MPFLGGTFSKHMVPQLTQPLVSIHPLTEMDVPVSVACPSETRSQLHGFQGMAPSTQMQTHYLDARLKLIPLLKSTSDPSVSGQTEPPL